MQSRSLMRRCRSATWKTWLGVALAVWLLVAESFAVTHPLDRAAHADGQPCAVCLSVANLGAGAAAADVAFVLETAALLAVVAVVRRSIVERARSPVRTRSAVRFLRVLKQRRWLLVSRGASTISSSIARCRSEGNVS